MFYAICGISIFLFSCREEEADICMDSAQRIYLRATVENTILMSRAPFSLLAPNEDNLLKAAVWASTTSYKFEHVEGADGSDGSGGMVALHTKANFSNGTEQLLNDAVYPKNDGSTKVYFVGMHPQEGWSTPNDDMAGKTAIKTFNGSEDVMFAPQIYGKYNENVVEWPIFKFKHLLTWLRVKVKADDETVSEVWGGLKSLKVKGSNGNTVTIDLSKEYSPDYKPGAAANCVTFSSGGDVTLNFYKTGTDDVFPNSTAPSPIPYDEYKEVAYVLCAPVIASERDVTQEPDDVKTNEYTLIVETEQRTVEVPVDLMENESTYFEGSTMNHQFILNLNFKMGDNIILTQLVKDWETGGISNGVLNP